MLSRIGWTLLAAVVSLTMRRGVRYWHLRWDLCRAFIRKRDGYKCRKCERGAKWNVRQLHVHHKRHVEHGGGYGPLNLVLLCDECHNAEHSDD